MINEVLKMQNTDLLFKEFFAGSLFKYACLLTGCPHNAKDLLQDVALRLIPHKDTLITLSYNQQKAYAKKTCKNLYLDSKTKKKIFAIERIELNTPEEILKNKEASLLKKQLIDKAIKFLLSKKYGPMFIEKLAGAKCNSIAKNYKVSLGTVLSNLYVGRKDLQNFARWL